MRNGIGRRMRFIGVMALAGVALPAAAYSYGVEVPENGTVAYGRGGAFVARASDTSAVAHNMAGILGLGGWQLGVNVNVGASSNCFQRAGAYEGNSDTPISARGTRFATLGGGDDLPQYAGRPYPEVCSNTAVALAAQVLASYRVNRWLAFGFGLNTPSTPGSGQVFNDTVTLPGGLLAPTPARNMLFQKDLLVLYLPIGVAIAPHPRVRLGLTFEPGFARFQFGVMANAQYASPQSPDSDLLIRLDASGLFLGAAASTQILINRFLSFGAQFHFNAPVSASGTATTTANYYAAPASGQIPGTFTIEEMKVQLPWNLRAGLRFAFPRAGAPHTQDDGTGQYDPMRDDLFDVEADYSYERTSLLGTTSISNSGSINVGTNVPAPRTIALNSNLADVMGFRIGGDFNVIANRLALRAGFSYETQALNDLQTVVHIPAYGGASVHLGASYRWRWLTISLGVGTFFFTPVNATSATGAVVTPGDPSGAQINPAACSSSQGQGTCTINRGNFHGNLTNGSLGFAFRF
jgi:long-subunit fatty acid transport protein